MYVVVFQHPYISHIRASRQRGQVFGHSSRDFMTPLIGGPHNIYGQSFHKKWSYSPPSQLISNHTMHFTPVPPNPPSSTTSSGHYSSALYPSAISEAASMPATSAVIFVEGRSCFACIDRARPKDLGGSIWHFD